MQHVTLFTLFIDENQLIWQRGRVFRQAWQKQIFAKKSSIDDCHVSHVLHYSRLSELLFLSGAPHLHASQFLEVLVMHQANGVSQFFWLKNAAQKWP